MEAAGCEIVRCAVPVREAAEQLGAIKKKIRIPLVADIHFNYKLVSPMPSASSVPNPTADLIVPTDGVPASVTPR